MSGKRVSTPTLPAPGNQRLIFQKDGRRDSIIQGSEHQLSGSLVDQKNLARQSRVISPQIGGLTWDCQRLNFTEHGHKKQK